MNRKQVKDCFPDLQSDLHPRERAANIQPLVQLASLLTFESSVKGCQEAAVADRRVGAEANEQRRLRGLKPGRKVGPTEGPQQRRAGCSAVPHLEEQQQH